MRDFDFQLYRLSPQFYLDYTRSQFPEILRKYDRPYSCFVFEISEGVFICIPYRSNISHQSAYLFRQSARSQQSRSGLDFSKLVVVQNLAYLEDEPAPLVDQDEYRETVQNIEEIAQNVIGYIRGYMDHQSGKNQLHHRDYQRRYGFSTLPYFKHMLSNIF